MLILITIGPFVPYTPWECVNATAVDFEVHKPKHPLYPSLKSVAKLKFTTVTPLHTITRLVEVLVICQTFVLSVGTLFMMIAELQEFFMHPTMTQIHLLEETSVHLMLM